MLILATFFPANDASGQEGMDFVGVWNMKNKINLIICIGNGPGQKKALLQNRWTEYNAPV
jgi:hypothetical protein